MIRYFFKINASNSEFIVIKLKGEKQMATVIRPELSSKSEYWIDKHRYYELKHFCLQYNAWKRAYADIDGFARTSAINSIGSTGFSGDISDVTSKHAMLKSIMSRRIDLIEGTAMATDPTLYKYIIKAVTEGLSFTYLKTKLDIPCGRSTYYKLYRKFFWLLHEARD